MKPGVELLTIKPTFQMSAGSAVADGLYFDTAALLATVSLAEITEYYMKVYKQNT